MDAGDGKKYKLVNAYQELVEDAVHTAMAKREMCRCDKCFLDACAYVYNKGFSRFVTTPQGEVFAQVLDMNQAKQVQLLVAVEEALTLIAASPKHG